MPCSWAALMKRLNASGPPYPEFDGEQVGRVVTPRDVAGELEGRHDLHGAHAKVAQVRQPPRRPVEVPSSIRPGVERPDVELVDHEIVPGRHLEPMVAPVERRRVVHDGVADRARDLPGIRVDPPDLVAVRGPDPEAVLVAGLDALDVRGPRAARPVPVAGERRCLGRPGVIAPGHEDRLGVRCPDPERRPAVVRQRAHPGARRRGDRPHLAGRVLPNSIARASQPSSAASSATTSGGRVP